MLVRTRPNLCLSKIIASSHASSDKIFSLNFNVISQIKRMKYYSLFKKKQTIESATNSETKYSKLKETQEFVKANLRKNLKYIHPIQSIQK